MAQWVRMFTAFSEDQSLDTNTYRWVTTTYNSSFQGISCSLLTSCLALTHACPHKGLIFKTTTTKQESNKIGNLSVPVTYVNSFHEAIYVTSTYCLVTCSLIKSHCNQPPNLASYRKLPRPWHSPRELSLLPPCCCQEPSQLLLMSRPQTSHM